MMFKVHFEHEWVYQGKNIWSEGKSIEKNSTGNIIIFLCQDESEEMADKVDRSWIMKSLIYYTKESFIQICILL